MVEFKNDKYRILLTLIQRQVERKIAAGIARHIRGNADATREDG